MYTPSLADANFSSRAINAFDMHNSSVLFKHDESEIVSPTGAGNPMGAIKVEKQGSFTESASSPSGKKPLAFDAEAHDSKRRIVTSAFEAAVIKVKSSIMQSLENQPSLSS